MAITDDLKLHECDTCGAKWLCTELPIEWKVSIDYGLLCADCLKAIDGALTLKRGTRKQCNIFKP